MTILPVIQNPTSNSGAIFRPRHHHTLMLLRSGSKHRLPYKVATGSHETRLKQAAFYLSVVKDDDPELFLQSVDQAVIALGIIVCNLRNFYLLSQDETVDLMKTHYLTKHGHAWTWGEIRLIHDEVESFTPTLGLLDEDAIAAQEKHSREENLTDIVLYLKPEGRISFQSIMTLYQEWFPDDTKVNRKNLGDAIKAVTGLKSTSYRGKTHYIGMSLPEGHEAVSRLPPLMLSDDIEGWLLWRKTEHLANTERWNEENSFWNVWNCYFTPARRWTFRLVSPQAISGLSISRSISTYSKYRDPKPLFRTGTLVPQDLEHLIRIDFPSDHFHVEHLPWLEPVARKGDKRSRVYI